MDCVLCVFRTTYLSSIFSNMHQQVSFLWCAQKLWFYTCTRYLYLSGPSCKKGNWVPPKWMVRIRGVELVQIEICCDLKQSEPTACPHPFGWHVVSPPASQPRFSTYMTSWTLSAGKWWLPSKACPGAPAFLAVLHFADSVVNIYTTVYRELTYV